jgi:outer membrane protein
MVVSSRGIVALGLSLAGVAYLAAPSIGQAQQQADSGVRKAANPSTTASGPKAPAAIAPVIGTIDLDVVLKNYDKVKATSKEFNAAMMLRRGELQKIEAEARQEAEYLSKLSPGTDDYRKRENRITELRAKMEAGREQAEREFSLRQAETFATLYKEIQAMVARVAQWRGMTYVMRVSNAPPSGTEPNSVLAALNNTMVYADPRNDITNDVVYYLNRTYQATAAPAPTTKASLRQPGAVNAPTGSAQPADN